MGIVTAEFIKGITGDDSIIRNGIPHIALIGRSNVGKSSIINSLTNRKSLAQSSSKPGKTQQINFYLINHHQYYLVDLPGYGFAEGSFEHRNNITKLIHWYLVDSHIKQKRVVLIIDAKVGFTDKDKYMLNLLEESGKDFIVVANKTDQLNSSELTKSLNAIQTITGAHPFLPFSNLRKSGVANLIALLEK